MEKKYTKFPPSDKKKEEFKCMLWIKINTEFRSYSGQGVAQVEGYRCSV